MKSKISKSSEDDEGSDHFKTARLSEVAVSAQDPIFQSRSFKSVIIRKINPSDPEDIKRITLIDKSSEVLKYMVGKPLEKENEIQEFITDTNERILYAVAGSHFLPKEEIGKLQGWILVYSGKEVVKRAVRALGKGVLESKLPILEVSYAKYPNAMKGQIGNGLRQVLLAVANKDGIDLKKDASHYQRLVTAYIDPDNTPSRYVVESAGFILHKKRIFWNPKLSKKKDLVYILDWRRLYHKTYEVFPHPSSLEASNSLH